MLDLLLLAFFGLILVMGFRQGLIMLLLIYCGITTITAAFPVEAVEKWSWVWKALVFATFLPLTLTTRLRIEAAALVMALSVATIINQWRYQDRSVGRRLWHADLHGQG